MVNFDRGEKKERKVYVTVTASSMPSLPSLLSRGAAMVAMPTILRLLLLSSIILSSFFTPAYGVEASSLPLTEKESNLPEPKQEEPQPEGLSREKVWTWRSKNVRRLMIGSTAPTCSYNECRGCRFRCSAEQVPVDANDPINSAYHYRCVCHKRE